MDLSSLYRSEWALDLLEDKVLPMSQEWCAT